MTRRQDVLDMIWGGKDPFWEKSLFAGRVDFQGWGSEHAYLLRAIDEVQPRTIVEVGVWKGGSTMSMATHLKQRGLDGVVIAVDTWLGSWDHWLQPTWFEHLRFEGGYPTLYKTFAANVIERNLTNYVVPLPLDSVNAAVLAKAKAIRPQVIHIDAGHDYDAVMSDLRLWWPLLEPGGVLIGDDYHATGDVWPGVRQAFQDFFKTTAIENAASKCYIAKPTQTAETTYKFKTG
jgi:hypothetical protein